MDLVNQIEKSLGDGKDYFNVDSNNLKENISYIKEKKLININLNPYKGYKLKDINWLKEITFIKSLEMGSCPDLDFSGLRFLKNLESLIFSAENNQQVDLSELSNLKRLSFEYNENIKGLERLVNLKLLWVWKGNESFFNKRYFEVYENLRYLKIVQSIMPDSLYFLEKNNKLKEIEFSHCRSNINLNGIDKLNTSLKSLKIVLSKKVENVALITNLEELESLILVDSVTLEGYNQIENLKKLNTLSMYGSSFFENGDLSNMKDQYVNLNIQNKKHYVYPVWYKKR